MVKDGREIRNWPYLRPAALSWLLVWLAGGAVLVTALGIHPVSRAQEARVLETAREMLDGGWDQWLIPQVNGHVRLRKPPLVYWLTVGSFTLFGVSDGAGRFPSALAGWFTLGLTFAVARWLFSQRAGFFAAVALLGSILFFRQTRLGETDSPVMLFVTLAVFALWRGYRLYVRDLGRPAHEAASLSPPTSSGLPAWVWFHLSAAAIALAILSKGPPAAYPLIFLLVLSCIERQWRAVWGWFASAAPLTLIILAAPWFIYLGAHPQSGLILDALQDSALGKGHSGWFFVYGPELMGAVAPWSGLVVLAVVIAIKRGWRDERVRGLLLWAAAIFVPLCVWGNKQAHYLLPLLPPLMILVGWLVDRTLDSDPPAGVVKWVRRVWLGTVVLCLAASPAVIWASSDQRGWITPTDIGLSMSVLLLFTGVLLIHHRWGLQAGMVTFGIVVVVAMAAGVGVWAASLEPVTFRSLSQEIRAEFGSDPYAFYKRESLPLCFNLRRVIPVIGTEQELQQSLAEEPRLVVIDIADDDSARALLSEGTVKDKLLGNSKRRLRLYYAIDR